MKAAVIVLALCATAHADSPAEQVVRAHLNAVIGHADTAKTLADDATLISTRGRAVKAIADVGAISGKITTLHVGLPQPGEGWFHAVITGKDGVFRVAGMIADDGGWKVKAEIFTQVVSDAKLMANLVAKVDHDDMGTIGFARQIGQMLPGDSASGSPEGAVVSGTAPGEYADERDGVEKLVDGWDKLPLYWKNFQMVMWNDMAFVWGEVRLDSKTKGKVVPMTLGMVLYEPPGDTLYDWKAIAFAAPVAP